MYLIDTTVNLKSESSEYLEQLKINTGMKKKDIVLFVLGEFRKKAPKNEKLYRNAEYQKKNRKWKKFHLRFPGAEREISFDMRKMYKMSLSFIVAFALSKYGDLLLTNDIEKQGQILDEIKYSYTSQKYVYYSNGTYSNKVLTLKWILEEKKE